MNFAFPWPYSQGEWLAWGAAAFTVFLGMMAVFAPGLRMLGFRAVPNPPEGLSALRAQLGGFYVGVGLCAILFAQPLIYMTLGVAWALSAFARIGFIMADRGGMRSGWIGVIVALVLAGLPLAFAFGLVR